MNGADPVSRVSETRPPAGLGADDLNRLFEQLYPELRRMAHGRLRGGSPDALLDTTMLVHESYERLAAVQGLALADRAHFLAYAAQVMRSVVVDMARESQAQRRGGGAWHVTLTTSLGAALASDAPDVLAVHEALEALAHIDLRLARVVEMRYFGGLDNGEIAQALGLSLRSVERAWEKARSFLYATLKPR